MTQALRENPISASVDFQRDGVQHGHLKLPYSRDDSAWGAVMIPVCVVKNGDGPTALLTGGNHGDEYEGPVALSRLAQELRAEDVRGRVIIVPFMNTPAFLAGKRTSPIDAGNLNRSFPGRPDGTVTQKIADYFQRTLLPLADVVLDIHSGGRTLDSFRPHAWNIERFLDRVDAEYGGVHGLAMSIGIDEETVARLSRRLLEV